MDVRRALVAGAVAVVLTACATPSTGPGAPAPMPTLPPTFPAAPNGVELPTPPPAPEAPPEAPPETPPETPSDAPSAASPASGAPAAVAGYTGDQWAAELDGEVRVLGETLSRRDGIVRGLVRNGRGEPVGPVTVAVGEVQATVAVPVLRPGEPAPFELALDGTDLGDVPVEELDVVVSAPTTTEQPARGVRLSTFWRRGVVDERPVDTYLFTDPASGPQPAVAFGEVLAVDAVDGLVVVAAWVDDDGRVVAVDAAAELQADAVEPGGAVDFVVVSDGPPALDAAALVLWGSGS